MAPETDFEARIRQLRAEAARTPLVNGMTLSVTAREINARIRVLEAEHALEVAAGAFGLAGIRSGLEERRRQRKRDPLLEQTAAAVVAICERLTVDLRAELDNARAEHRQIAGRITAESDLQRERLKRPVLPRGKVCAPPAEVLRARLSKAGR
jgi:hypothetical protein